MPLQSSGQISLNDLHVEAGGTTGTQCSMNDSDIRGLVSAAANSQMTFSGFYGASSSILTTTITVGAFGIKGIASYGYSHPNFGAFGSISDTTISTKNNGNANVAELQSTYNNTNWSLYFTMKDYGTDNSNSGFNSLTVNGVTYYRTDAAFTAGTNIAWSWVPFNYNPLGTTTIGDTVTVVID